MQLSFLQKISLNETMQGKIPKTDNPLIEQIPEWSKTPLGTALSLFQNLKRKDVRPYLFVGGVHGDEPEGVRLAEEFLLWLKTHSKETDHPWILVPCLNPDGFKINQRTNSQGVDLNRNFPSRDWTSSVEKNRYYPGPSPASEPEVKALAELITKTQPCVIIHFHSWKPCVVYTGAPGQIYAEFLTQENHYDSHPDIGYPTPGSLGQYGWLEHQIPVVCIEEKENEDLEKVWPHFKTGLIGLVQGKLP